MGIETNILRLSDCDLTPEKIVVKHSGLVKAQRIPDPDGDLIITETGINLPLDEVPRVYRRHVINPDSVSGLHAHKETKQVIFCAAGSFMLHLDDGDKKQDILMDVEDIGVKLWPRLWHSMSHFEPHTVIMVHANTYFETLGQADYIRDYNQFLEYARSFMDDQ